MNALALAASPHHGDGLALAAIDMGSNSFRLEIGSVRHERYQRIEYLKETVRLGGGLDAEGMLGNEAIERALACLRRFAMRLRDFPAAQVRAVATQTLREARNRNHFLLQAQAALGFPIEVISGREEARLIYAGVARLQPSRATRLVVDIGGRSTELILGRGEQPLRAESFAVGSVSSSLRWFPDGRLTAEGFRNAQVAAGAEFEEALAPFARPLWTQALGSSGTAGAVSEVMAALGLTDGRITPLGLRRLIERCIEAGHADRLDWPALKPERRAVIGGGIAILYTLATHFDIEALFPAKGALRQGVICELASRLQPQQKDLRDGSVADLQKRFSVDTEQAERVRALALAFHAALDPGASTEAHRELGWAAALHEIGLMVSHHDHHRHSAYVMAHVDAPGFSQSQQRRIGDLVLAQRGGLRKVESVLAQPGAPAQVLALRLAVIVAHARAAAEPAEITLAPRNGDVRVSWRSGAERGHERTRFLLQEEAAVWARHGPLRLQLPA